MQALFAKLGQAPRTQRANIAGFKAERVQGTCEWIFKNTNYTQWHDNPSHPLWIRGGPGKGKTMLAIHLTEELEAQHQYSDTTVAYHFCEAYDGKNTSTAILNSLLFVMASSNKG